MHPPLNSKSGESKFTKDRVSGNKMLFAWVTVFATCMENMVTIISNGISYA